MWTISRSLVSTIEDVTTMCELPPSRTLDPCVYLPRSPAPFLIGVNTVETADSEMRTAEVKRFFEAAVREVKGSR